MSGKRKIYCCLFIIVLFVNTGAGLFGRNANVNKRKNIVYLENNIIQARFIKDSVNVRQEYYAKKGDKWLLVAQSIFPETPYPQNANKLFDTSIGTGRILVNGVFNEITKIRNSGIRLTGLANGTEIQQEINISGNGKYFHIEVTALFPGKPVRLEYLLSTFTFNHDSVPEFVHTPTLKYDEYRWKTPAEDQIIGDRCFHSPAIILQDRRLFTALVPDLNVINEQRIQSPDARRTILIPRNKFSVPVIEEKYTMPTGLDLNVRSGLTDKPVFSFGIIDNVIQHHIRYLHPNDGSMIRTLDTERVVYGFDLFIGSDVEEYTGYQQIIQHLWANFGHTVFNEERHLAMPFTEYVRTVQDVTFQPLTVHPPVTGFKDTGSFLEFELNGQKLGGYRSAVPGWLDAIWNCMFWNNARDAAGMYYWGSQLNDQSLIDKARRTINLILLSPGNEYGLFPLIYRAGKNEWQTNSFDVFNKKFGLFSAGSDCQTYDVVSMNLTCAYLIVYYQKCENDDRILSFVKKYGNWVTSIVDEAGVIPSYVSTDMQESEVLKYSAQPAAGMWFLSELYSVTNDTKYLKAAENIAQYLITQIIPRQKWIDMEQYFSCGIKPLNFIGDEEQGQLARGNLSIGWAAKGFASLYRACGKDIYLRAGERCIDYLSFSQCSWDPHFIYTAYPFGGFSVDNSDHATYLDARQAEFVDPYIWYGKVLGRQDLLERGVAAARSSIVLINHPLHKGNSIYEHTNIYPDRKSVV